MKTATESFDGGYTATLEIDDDESQCFVSWIEPRTRREFTASLACLEGTGLLVDAHFEEHSVDECVIEEIVGWAVQEGY